ncbi:hypothetical protein V498_07884 [Pseudogymnoascus sp. VKM F-4517 (FW-2822)]|nr:hypothetical protein V498_07884 [Pseudogymnoascus sp. VKM F-4517 (FW-2822)]
MGPTPRTPNVQPFCSEHRGIHTSLYSSLPQEAVQFLEKAIWFKMVGRTDDARAIFGDELKRFEKTPVVAIEHAELEFEAGKWGRAWRILHSRLIDLRKSHEDLDSPEHRLILLTWAMLGTRHRGDLASSAREIERTQVWLGNVPVSDYSDIQASCIRRYVIAYLFTMLYNGYKNTEAEHLPAHDRLDSSGSKIPWGGLRQLRRSLTERGMFNEANALFRVEVNRTPPEHRRLILEEFLREVASLSSYRGKEFVEAAVRLQWASTHVQLQATSSAVEEFSKSELAFSRFCDRFDITDKSLTPHMQALEYERLSCIEGPVNKLKSAEELANRFEAIDGFKTGLCLSTAAELALDFYKAKSLEVFRVKYFSLQTRLETYDVDVSEDICDLVHHHVELSSATLGGLVDRQNALEWIDGFFTQYPHFSAPVVLALLYRSKESLLKGLRRIEEARLAGQKATEMEAFEPSLGKWLHTGQTYPALPLRSTTDSADPHSQDEEEDESQPFYWSWRDVIGDEIQIQERVIQLVLTWLDDEIAAENPALKQFKGITAHELKELVFTEPKMVDASKEERYSQICTWLGEPPRGERNRRLFCLLMLRDARQTHLENKKLWELRLAELGHLLELEKRLPRVIRQNFRRSKGSWLAAMALTHLACLESVSDFTDEKSMARLLDAETYNEFALDELRQQNDQARVAIHQRSGAQICMLKITRLKQLSQQAASVVGSSTGKTVFSSPDAHGMILPAESVEEIMKLRVNGIDKAKEADAIFSQGELHASRSAGLDGITNRQNLTAFYGSAYTVHKAISLLLAEPGKPTAETIKSAWQWVQKYKARSLARTIGVRIFDPPELINKIMASPETASLYQEMLAMQKKIEEATPTARFDLRRQLDAHLQFMKANHDLLRQLIDLREATPFELSDIASIEAQCGTQVVLADWFYLPGYVVGETGKLLLFTANGRSETTMDLLTTTLEDVTAWQKAYLNPTEYIDYQEENLDKDEAREAFDKMLGGLVAPLAHHTKAGKLPAISEQHQAR